MNITIQSYWAISAPSVILCGFMLLCHCLEHSSFFLFIAYEEKYTYLFDKAFTSFHRHIDISWRVNHFIPLTALVPYTSLFYHWTTHYIVITGLLASFPCKTMYLKVKDHILFFIYQELCFRIVELKALLSFSIFWKNKNSKTHSYKVFGFFQNQVCEYHGW